MKKDSIIVITAGFFGILTSVSLAIFGLYVGKIVDAISEGDFKIFILRVLLAGVFLLCQMVFCMLSKRLIYMDCRMKTEKIKDHVYHYELLKNRADNVDIAKFSSKIDLVYSDYFERRWYVFEKFTLFLFCSIAIISVSWIMFIVAIVVALIPMLVPLIFKNYINMMIKNYTDESTAYLDYVSNTMQGRLEIVKYNVLEIFCKKHSDKSSKFEGIRSKTKVANANLGSATNTIGSLTILFVFLIGGLLTHYGFIAVGGVVGVIQLMNNVVNPMVEIAAAKSKINASKQILEELRQEAKSNYQEKNETLPTEACDCTLLVENLCYQYPSSKNNVINNYTYAFSSNKKYLIRGESGSGKSTLAKLISGEFPPVSGQIKINGTNIQEIDSSYLSCIIRYVDQKSYVFNDSVYNNISMYRNIDKNRILSIIKTFGLSEIDINNIINDDSGVSGGQKSRICLARAVSALPKILIVDEPTAALDVDTAYEIVDFLCSLPITVIIVSHSNDERIIKLFNEVIDLRKQYI